MSYVGYYTPDSRLPRAGLNAWGCALLIFGIIFGALAVLVGFSAIFRNGAVTTTQGVRAASFCDALVYLFAAAALIWIGIGSWIGQRWVRPIAMFASAAVFCVGLTVSAAAAVPMYRAVSNSTTSQTVRLIANTIILTPIVSLLLVVPAMSFCFYKRPQTRETLAKLDSASHRWTDGTPTALLAWVIGWILLGVNTLPAALRGYTTVFSAILRGLPAVAFVICNAALMFVGAWLCYRRRAAGWWLTIVLSVFGTVSNVSFAMNGNSDALFNAARPPSRTPQRRVTTSNTRALRTGIQASAIAIDFLLLSFGFYARRFVRREANEPAAIESSQPS